MGCLPKSGGCERHRTDPFVDHLNWFEGTNYVHKACLDVIYRNTPQPEALYIDEGSGARLVIERKNLVWPPDYAVGHNNGHFLADRITDGLRNVISDDAYEIHLDFCVSGSSEELETFARQIIETVRTRLSEIRAGAVVGGSEPGRRWRLFRGDKGLRAFENNPETGLGFHWGDYE